jgi:predicted small lipoprotein YifL
MRKVVVLLAICSIFVPIAACGRKENPPVPPAASAAPAAGETAPAGLAASAMPSIDPQAVLQHIKVLASDKFEGRAPGTRGEELTAAYLETQFRDLGLQPGNPDGTYIQKVPLVGIKAEQTRPLTFVKGSQAIGLKWRDDVVAWTKHVADTASISKSDVVFVGYGVEAPE